MPPAQRRSQRVPGPHAAGPADRGAVLGQLRQLRELGAKHGSKAILARLEKGIAALESNYCAGFQLRGTKYLVCSYHAADTKWRIIYGVDRSRRVPVLRIVGEHYLPVSVNAYQSPNLANASPLTQALQWDDVYRQVVRAQAMNAADVGKMVQEVRGVESGRWRRCCH